MKKIKIIKPRPLKEEEEVIDQIPQDTTPEVPAITFESNPLEFILQKYPTLNATLIELLTEDFRDYITGIYIMAPKPTVFKVVLHNGRSFHLIFMGETYQAKVSGKKYYLSKISELQNATMSIAELLMLGTPPQAEGPSEELPPAGEEKSEESSTVTPEETPAEEEGGAPEELKESVKRFKLIESKLLEYQKLEYNVLTPDAKVVAQDLIKQLKITQDQIQPASSTNIVVYTDDDRKKLIKKVEDLKTYGKATDPNKGNFKYGKISINFKPLKTSGEFYELKPQKLGVTTDEFISINQLKKELITGIQNHKTLNDEQKSFIIGLINNKNTLSPEETKEVLSDKYFENEVLKNLGELIGAMIYAKQVNGKYILFPKSGSFPLIDYMVKTDDGVIEVSAKTSKGKGNLIKLPDVYKKIMDKKIRLTPDQKKLFQTVSSDDNSPTVTAKTMNLIPIFGKEETQRRYKKFLKNNPGFLNRKLRDGSKYGYDSVERVSIEKMLINDLNEKFDLNKVFRKAVDVKYVKYNFDRSTLKGNIEVIEGDEFEVYLDTKNSVNHDGEGIGFQLA
jgi:hypothetical protein